MEQSGIRSLIETALAMRARAYVPYSNFRVGAALLGKSGSVYTGCNVENGAYSPSNCAERTAFFKAVSEGEREFTAICVVGGPGEEAPKSLCPPCGVCRQVMLEFCDPSFQVILATDPDHYQVLTLEELVPYGFRLSEQQ